MIAMIYRFRAKDGMAAAFERTMLDVIEWVRANEPRTQLYTLCRGDDGRYVVLEMYATDEDMAAHGQSEVFKEKAGPIADLLDGAPEVQRLEVVG